MISLAANYQQIAANVETSLTRVADQPSIKREVEYYKAHIGKIKSVDDFMNDRRLYTFAMTAFGLKDMLYAKAFIRKALDEGIDSKDAFSLKLADHRFREFVEVFNFKRYQGAATAFDRAQQGTVDRYLRLALEEQAGEQNEALRLALYFERKAGDLTSEYSILGDQAVYTVVRTALGLPQAMSGTDIDKQAKILGERVNISDFADSTKLKRFVSRFLAQYELQNSSPGASTVAGLFAGASPAVDMNTLLSIQSLKKFGS